MSDGGGVGAQGGLFQVGYSAVVSPCETYRYLLTRMWDQELPGVLFVMLNPSTADANQDDPTIRRCIRFARDWGHGALRVVNLFAYRATDPRALALADDPVGPENFLHVTSAILASSQVVVAWGAHSMAEQQSEGLLQEIRGSGKVPMCLGQCAGGAPRHPLYVKGNTLPVGYGRNL